MDEDVRGAARPSLLTCAPCRALSLVFFAIFVKTIHCLKVTKFTAKKRLEISRLIKLSMTTAKIDSGLFRNPNRDLYVNTTGKKKPDLDDYGYPKLSSW